MILFGDDAHTVMIDMLDSIAVGRWLVTPLRGGQDPGDPDAPLVVLDRCDKEGLHGRVFNPVTEAPALAATTFDWVTYPTVQVH